MYETKRFGVVVIIVQGCRSLRRGDMDLAYMMPLYVGILARSGYSESMGMVNYRREGVFPPNASKAGSRGETGFI